MNQLFALIKDGTDKRVEKEVGKDVDLVLEGYTGPSESERIHSNALVGSKGSLKTKLLLYNCIGSTMSSRTDEVAEGKWPRRAHFCFKTSAAPAPTCGHHNNRSAERSISGSRRRGVDTHFTESFKRSVPE